MRIMKIIDVEIRDEFITLGQLIKVVNLVSSGGETKSFLLKEKIEINGELDSRRGRKLYRKDHIIIQGKEYVLC